MTLDIIVPHYKEPWEEGKKLFDMLALQRDVDFSEFRVLLIDDGGEHDISEKVFRQKYPYEVVSIIIPHAGVSAARNRGIRYSRAKWVMFCDFDDTFTSIYSLRSIFDALGSDRHDLLWCPFYVELNAEQKRQIRQKFNLIFIHGKIYRRQFLIEHGIMFEESLYFSEDAAFNQLVNMEIEEGRIGEIKSEIVPYVWTFRPGSVTTSPENSLKNHVGLFRRQKYVAMQHLMHGDREAHDALCIRAMCDAYVTFNRLGLEGDKRDFAQEALSFWRNEGPEELNPEIVEYALRGALKEFGLTEKDINPDAPPFEQWLDDFTEKGGEMQ